MLKPNLCNNSLNIGALPVSYLQSLSYEEQLLCIGKKIEEIIAFTNNILEKEINEYINLKFNDIFMNSMYDANTETLILFLDKKED